MTLFPIYLKRHILKENEKHPEQLIHWLEGDSRFDALCKIAASEADLQLPQPSLWKQLLGLFQPIVWTDAKRFYGRSHVTPELVTEAETTATTIGVANLLNTLTTYPYLCYVFANAPNGLGVLLAGGLGLLLNKVGNKCGEAACRHRYRKGAIAAVGGAALLNMVLTLTAGPGVELLLNGSGLAERRGQELIQKNILDTTLSDKALAKRQEWAKTAQTECQTILERLHDLPPNHPNRDLLYEQAYGLWKDRNRDWSQVATSSLPLCHKAAQLEEAAQTYAAKIQTEQEAKHAEIRRYGSALLYLQAVHPNIYRTHFDQEGLLRSGLVASRLSLQGFAQKLMGGDVADLGFPLFFFILSSVTSGIALVNVTLFGQRKDALRSWDPELYQLREELFYRVERGLYQAQDLTSETVSENITGLPRLSSPKVIPSMYKGKQVALSPKQRFQHRFLALCLEDIRLSGQCDYPPLLQLIEQHTQESKARRSVLRNVYLQERRQEALASYHPLVQAIQTLQTQEAWANVSQILQAVQIITQETTTLERVLTPIYPFGSSGVALLKRLEYLRAYLLKKLSDTHFLSPQGLQAKQLLLYHQQRRRIYRYLGELQSVTQDLMELPFENIDPSQQET